jgi:acyl carrier protein
LTALAGGIGLAEQNPDAPRTPTEERLAAAWAEVLSIPKDRIGRGDSFFELGGTSLSAVKLAIALGRAVSLKQIAEHPILVDLANLIDGASERRAKISA